MKIYIPPHIKKLGIVRDLCSMITKYAELNVDVQKGSLDYYYYYKTLSYDSVKSFIGICKYYNNSDSNSTEDDINYITNLFYAVKGTNKIFDYLTRFLNIKFENYVYDVGTGELYINLDIKTYNDIFKSDEETFKNSFEKFLKAVLYVKNLSINVSIKEVDNLLSINVENNLDLYYKVDCHNYTITKVTPKVESE